MTYVLYLLIGIFLIHLSSHTHTHTHARARALILHFLEFVHMISIACAHRRSPLKSRGCGRMRAGYI